MQIAISGLLIYLGLLVLAGLDTISIELTGKSIWSLMFTAAFNIFCIIAPIYVIIGLWRLVR